MDRKQNLNLWLQDTEKEMKLGHACAARGNVDMLLCRFREANRGESINETLDYCYSIGLEIQPLY